jgi:16S rRNA (guanine527-N7)-methyltransferase
MPPEALAGHRSATSLSLQDGLQAIGLELPQDRIEKLEHFLELLQRWNRVYNLTALRDPQDMLEQHLLDSLAVIPELQTRGLMPSRMADLGSGAGLPGLVLAIACPDLQLLSIEPVGKKTAFQQQAVSELGLAHVKIIQKRAEQVAESVDVLLCRALCTLSEFIRIAARLIHEGSRLVALKGRRSEIDTELSQLPAGWRAEVVPIHVPGLNAERHLVILNRP